MHLETPARLADLFNSLLRHSQKEASGAGYCGSFDRGWR
jgi:hypothetical protein